MIELIRKALRYSKRKVLYILNTNCNEMAKSAKSAYEFSRQPVVNRTVVIVEPNDFHAETLPGYVRYFKKLKFDVVALLRKRNCDSGIFCRMRHEELPKVYCMDAWAMKWCLRQKMLLNYDFLFFSSSRYVERYGFYGLFFDYLGFKPKGRYGYFLVEHNFQSLEKSLRKKFVEVNRVFLLSAYQDMEFSVPMLNPHYFGKVAHHELGSIKTFIAVGAITGRNRSVSQLVEAVRSLETQGLDGFEVIVVGKAPEPELIADLPQQIRLLGYLDFPELFRLMENADFFLPLLDPKNEGHRRYLAGETTGSRQLILGFRKVPVIQQEFAACYEFDESNSFIYLEDNLAYGMKRALNLEESAYNDMVSSLEKLSEKVYKASLENLRYSVQKAMLTFD